MKKESNKKIHPVKKLRLKLGKNQVVFSDMMNIKQGTLSKIENGLMLPTIINVYNLRLVVKFSVARLISEIAKYNSEDN